MAGVRSGASACKSRLRRYEVPGRKTYALEEVDRVESGAGPTYLFSPSGSTIMRPQHACEWSRSGTASSGIGGGCPRARREKKPAPLLALSLSVRCILVLHVHPTL